MDYALADFWDTLLIESMDLFAPVLAVSSRTAGGQVIRARSFGSDLWQANVSLASEYHGAQRQNRALLMLMQQPGFTFRVDDPTFRGPARPNVRLTAIQTDNRTITLSGLAANYAFPPGSLLSIGLGLYSVVGGGPANASGNAQINVVPHIRAGTALNSLVEVQRPSFKAVMDQIAPARFQSVVAGEAGFRLTQVFE